MRAVFSKIRSGTVWSASPIFFARPASIDFPVNIRSSAAAGPIFFGSHSMPCHAGTMPSMTSGKAKRVPGSSSATM